MKTQVVLYLSILWVSVVVAYPPDSCKTVKEVLKSYGYSSIQYNVTTLDGYILSIFRITGGKPHNEDPPLILMHGIASGADNFLGHGPQSHAIYFYKEGFDVWLPSIRGTKYSKGHVKGDYENYWDFSLEELGKYDTKAFIDFVYNVTGQKVNYLGYSQGFLQIMAGFSLEPEFYQTRVNKIMGWAPVVRIDLATHPAVVLGSVLRLEKIANFLGIKYLLEYSHDSCMMLSKMCDYSRILCKLRYLVSGDFYPYYDGNEGFSHGSESISMKVLSHFTHNFVNKGFYRYGTLEEYDLKKVSKVPIGLCVGEGDLLASVANGEWLAQIFTANGNLAIYKKYEYLGHMTFLGANSRRQHVIDTLEYFKKDL